MNSSIDLQKTKWTEVAKIEKGKLALFPSGRSSFRLGIVGTPNETGGRLVLLIGEDGPQVMSSEVGECLEVNGKVVFAVDDLTAGQEAGLSDFMVGDLVKNTGGLFLISKQDFRIGRSYRHSFSVDGGTVENCEYKGVVFKSWKILLEDSSSNSPVTVYSHPPRSV